ncbi:hypothetical protein A1O3_07028 [Capronia epimyces CBS 606.96]|uniref:Major facilitator superfamily (MFS) profile domain-containing protein n=1 Tax=Capronia epimyces CBS 606.96 TaxID=1182542 RepID=W9YEL3_9EURO|nr:uncharacterized protein A1O3_07028 [Capronia epimyces CBS 606.96]EXJ80744.1 hypothetical protein A1O3_07028 [Capronia epimyces CBS 606.96]
MGKLAVNTDVEPLDISQREHSDLKLKDGLDTSAKRSSWKFWSGWDQQSEERRLLTKLDLTITLFGFLGGLIKHIDRQNLTNAFVSGMKEDLGLYGNEMNYAQTTYSVVNILCIWPINLAMTRCNPRYFIPALEIGWTIATFASSAMKTPLQMYALRGLVGLFEWYVESHPTTYDPEDNAELITKYSGHFSAIMYVAGGWFQKRELAKRIFLINSAGHIGPMFSSYLQTAAYKGLNGTMGRAGWRWVFIIDGIISIGIALPQVFLFPDLPARQKPDRVFTEREIELARDRNPKEGRVKQGAITKKQLRRFFTDPQIWLLWVISAANIVPNQIPNSMAYWFKAWNKIKPGSFTVPQINDYITPIYAIELVLDLSWSYMSDSILRGRRWPFLLLCQGVMAVVSILLATTPVFPHNRAFRWFLYYMSGFINSSPPPLAVFKTVDQPAVVKGNWTGAGFCFAGILATATLAYIQHREKKQAREREGDDAAATAATAIEEVEEYRVPGTDAEEIGKLAPASPSPSEIVSSKR